MLFRSRERGMCSLFFRSIDVHVLQFIFLMFTYILFRNMKCKFNENKRKRRYCSNLQLTVQYIGRLFLITLTYILSDSAVWSKTATPATFEVLHITSYLSLIIYVVNFAKKQKVHVGPSVFQLN